MKNKTIHKLFEEQVKQNPDNIAIVFEEQSLTYKENQLAHKIEQEYRNQTNQNLQPDTLITLCLDRSRDTCYS